MSRQRQDPVERASAAWVTLTTDDQQRFEDRRAGYMAAMGQTDAPKPRARSRKRKVATEAEGQ
jgi:hypothetical protein